MMNQQMQQMLKMMGGNNESIQQLLLLGNKLQKISPDKQKEIITNFVNALNEASEEAKNEE